MKTKSWSTQKQVAPEVNQGPSILMPTFFEDQAGRAIGPLSLGLTMLKGMELARSLIPFSIKDEEGHVLLALKDNHLSGDDELVIMVQQMLKVSESMYENYFRLISQALIPADQQH